MDKYKETFETWNNLASKYQEQFMNLDRYNETYDFICNSITKDKANLLEIGCGPGNITKYLLSKKIDFNIFGIDIAPNMIELAQKNNPSAKFEVMDCREIGKIENKFDGIICGFCLPYLSKEETSKLIQDSYQLLNNEGLIYISFVEGEYAKSDFKTSPNGRVFFYFHELERIESELSSNDFEKLELFKISITEKDIHTILIAKRKS
ncbi:MAG: class I SAM-dependent methyltransferase [Candidatus Sericytochromatia bacterium]